MNALLDSRRAAAWVGPKARSPRRSNRSTRPAARGASGPTKVRSIPYCSAQAASAPISLEENGRHGAISPIPGLPGAQKSDSALSCRSFQAIACSRPPEPITRTFMAAPRRGGVPIVRFFVCCLIERDDEEQFHYSICEGIWKDVDKCSCFREPVAPTRWESARKPLEKRRSLQIGRLEVSWHAPSLRGLVR